MDASEPLPAARPEPPPQPPSRAARVWRPLRLLLQSTGTVLFSVLVTAGVLVAITFWLLATTTGMNTLIGVASRFGPVKIETKGGFGALTREFGFAEIHVTVGDTIVAATDLRARVRDWQRRPPRLDFAHLGAASLRVDITTDDSPPVQDIGLPLRLTTERLALGRLLLVIDGDEIHFESIDTKAQAGPTGYKFESGRIVTYGVHWADVQAELGAAWPFPLDGQAQVDAQLQDKAIGGALRARGSLAELSIDGELTGAASGTASALIASFDKPAVRSLAVDLQGVDPRLWHPAAPVADLAVQATLSPNAAMDRATGSVTIANRAPGRIDASRIPVRSASAQVDVDARQLTFDRINAQLLRGSASGSFGFVFADNSWQARLRLADTDPSQLHGALQPLRVDGQLQARQTSDTIFVNADLSNRGQPTASLLFDGRFTPALATINSARLTLGDGHAAAAGSVALTGSRRADLRGTLERFEPGRLVKGVDARLNGSFQVDGVLEPKPAGRLRFELADSRAYGRPLVGKGRIDIDGDQRLDVDVDLAVRSAKLAAKGGLGGPGRQLDFSVDAPAIADLLLSKPKVPVAGAVAITGSASGELTAPALALKINASGLRYGDHSLKLVEGTASYGGGSDGALSVLAGLAGYSYAPQSAVALQSASLGVEGRLSNHAIRLLTTVDKARSATLFADGGWRDDAWRGRVREASFGPPLDLRLLVPAALVIGLDGTEFGPAQIAVQEIRFDDVRFRSDDTGAITLGRFSGLEPMRYAGAAETARERQQALAAGRAPLSLRGDWDLRIAGERVDGRVLVEREGGDLYAGVGRASALGLVDARIDARIEANRLDSFVRIESARNGGIGAHLEAWVENSEEAGWRLAQARPWLISGAFDLPTMDWLTALASEQLRANIRLGGAMAASVRIEGTPAKPAATGRLTGTNLRAAWVEQGVRLENGRLLAHLQDEVIVLEEVHFSGPPRVQPDDRRAAAAAARLEKDGTLDASGQVRLRDLNGVIQVAVSRLPLLQQPDRWVVASGGANIETSGRHVQINGAFAADVGFVGLARTELPSLSSDVVVVRAGEAADARARRSTLGFDLGIELGDAFYLRGKGLSARAEGSLRLRSAGRGAVTAVGAIAAVDGVYEGFGQRLAIARGRLNFQGAPENPGLDILALRTGLPVEVGVTITRTAVDPLVRLHSDPPMAEIEALSWLVLGRPPDHEGGDNIALVQAAASLLAGGGDGYPMRVAKSLGVDEISIRSGNRGIASLLPTRGVAGALRSDQASAVTVAGEVVTIGKNLNEALTLSYQQGIADVTRIIQLNYRLTDRLSALARGGTDNALDFVYSFAFD